MEMSIQTLEISDIQHYQEYSFLGVGILHLSQQIFRHVPFFLG